MLVPPLLAGALQAIEAEVDKVVATAVTPVGGFGAVAGVAGAEAAEAAPVPTPLVAVTVKVYASPLGNPVITVGLAVLFAVWPPLAGVVVSVAVTVYPVMADPPLDAGAVQEMVDWVFWFEVAATPVGAPGVVAGTAGADGAEAMPVPTVLEAVTVKV